MQKNNLKIDVVARKAWENPEPLPLDSSHNETKDRECTALEKTDIRYMQ